MGEWDFSLCKSVCVSMDTGKIRYSKWLSLCAFAAYASYKYTAKSVISWAEVTHKYFINKAKCRERQETWVIKYQVRRDESSDCIVWSKCMLCVHVCWSCTWQTCYFVVQRCKVCKCDVPFSLLKPQFTKSQCKLHQRVSEAFCKVSPRACIRFYKCEVCLKVLYRMTWWNESSVCDFQ